MTVEMPHTLERDVIGRVAPTVTPSGTRAAGDVGPYHGCPVNTLLLKILIPG